MVSVVFNLAAFSVLSSLMFGALEGWDLLTGVYFTIITGTTIGYGDVIPLSDRGKWVCFGWMPIAVIFVSSQVCGVWGGEYPSLLSAHVSSVPKGQ